MTNSRGIAPVSGIDTADLTVDEELMKRVYSAYDSVEWDALQEARQEP